MGSNPTAPTTKGKIVNKQDKLKAISNIDKGICPACNSENFWLDEEGGEHESYICKDCGIEVYIGMKRVPEYCHIYDEKTDTETMLFDNSEINDK